MLNRHLYELSAVWLFFVRSLLCVKMLDDDNARINEPSLGVIEPRQMDVVFMALINVHTLIITSNGDYKLPICNALSSISAVRPAQTETPNKLGN